MDMAESTVGGVTESDRFISRPGSLNIEEESFVSELQAASPPSSATEKSGAVMTERETPPGDPSCPIKSMYRLLDLITEQGNNCLVDKIVIAQESLQAFINALSPGAYSSITTVNFKILDDLLLEPIGVYGSKEEIVRFLREMGSVDVEMERTLLIPERDYTSRGAEPILRSGLYIIRTSTSARAEQTYVVYWPEDTSWDDNAVSTVQRNRVMFMRYLTKLCDQLICLLSTEHSQAIVWGDEVGDLDDSSLDSENVDSELLMDFMVEKRDEQDESVMVRQGFTMNSSHLVRPPNILIDESSLSPRLLHGETTQGFMTAQLKPARAILEPFSHDYQSARQIRLLFDKDAVLCLSETLDDKALRTLMRTMELETRFPKEYEAWEKRRIGIEKRFQNTIKQRQEESHETLQKASGDLESKVREAVIDEILKAFPALRRDGFPPGSTSAAPVNSIPVAATGIESLSQEAASGDKAGTLYDVFAIYPEAETAFLDAMSLENIDNGINGTDFHFKKERMVILLHLLKSYPNLTKRQICSLRDAVLDNKDNQNALNLLKSFSKGEKTKWHSVLWRGRDVVLTKEEAMWKNANDYASSLSYSRFLSYVMTFPATNYLHAAAVKSEEAAYACLRTHLDSQVAAISQKILSIQKEESNKQIRCEVENEEQEELKDSRIEFVLKVEDLCRERSRSRNSIHIDEFKVRPKKYQKSADTYIIRGRKPQARQGQEIEYSVHILRLQADQRHNLQLDPSYVPTPVLNERLSQSFHVPSETIIEYAHLLEGDRILLCLVNSHGNFVIFLDHLSRMDSAILSRSYAKHFHRDKIGEKCLFAFDESKRLLAVYASAGMQLHMFQFDEELRFLRGYGAPINLLPFYDEGASITHACFVHGNEEILFIDSSAQARIFSLITLQPKPASLQLPQIPRAIYSAPDGSCLLVSQEVDGGRTVTAYHRSAFTSHSGILVTLPDFPVDLDAALLTSIVNRKNIYLVGLDLDSGSCRSVVLDISRKAAGFKFHERPLKVPSRHGKQTTAHNCLIDSHRDVWTRFPVVPAVKRHTITTSSQRQQKTLVFVTDDHRRPFSSHFVDMISTFEQTSRKPTDDELTGIKVSARSFPSFTREYLSSSDWPVSRFRAGEWLADLLCLIPIHIAITRKNRFVPLKDGVVSPQLEESILGAAVNRTVGSLTLGWYESIFQSYCVSKPVKVVSSMGEQSVGKSFTLNHLMDTSFSGSTLGTTEGVWMSVSPTDDALIVALDFQGIHSTERSAEEDMLLVLFNTAISNLVLFRVDLASTRDIGDLFQSFQSSSSVLDPASHPSLFQSTLVVTIKDVIDTDKAEVMERSALKFQQIVRDEHDANFITRLHLGKLQIIPWPVIGSRAFYRLFSAVKKKLDQQETSHRTAGEFLHTLKMWMAKLNANDWGTMSQTTAAHRARALLAILPVALQTGYSEVFPEHEPLKSFDTNLVIEAEDTKARFLLAGSDTPDADREHHLSMLRDSWHQSASRQKVDDSKWISDLGQYLTHLVDLRVAHVDEWLKLNTQSFQAEDTSKEELRQAFNSAVIGLRASVRFCRSQCATCNLFCIQSRFHEGNHDCLTSHKCILHCTFCDKQVLAEKTCGQTAGHKGDHMCRVDAHPCGQRCGLSGNHGCVDRCAKIVSHEGDHVCSAPVHMCGRPCDLVNTKLLDGKSFICPGLCSVPISEEHKVHACERRLCPISCQLCKRLCSGDHLHGLSPGENHLCGQEHPCGALCSADGICQIDTTALPIEATFTEKDETTQYAKFTQTAKRLPCVKMIEPGMIGHEDPHIHTNDGQPFHFCESRCEGCGYICTLPFGHSQPEHNTSHGPVLQTRWAIESLKGDCVDSGGLKLNDDIPPVPCSLVCSSMGRHVHIDYCQRYPHDNPEVLHINERLDPNPYQAKDWVTHGLYWRRMGFKDPYSSEDQANFAKCDAMCPGPEHTVEVGGANALPSRCTLPMFHPPTMDAASAPAGPGYMSNDGHYFECRDPVVIQHAFHIIFVVDRSESMSKEDIRPIPGSSGIERIKRTADNRLGAVFSALYSFWIERDAAVNRNSVKGRDRKDAYSLIFSNHEQSTPVEYDFTSSPDELLTAALHFHAHGDTDFSGAIERAQTVMTSHWSSERTTVVIFFSAGEDNVKNKVMYDLCRDAVHQGRPLLFHAVSFGQDSTSSSLREMAHIALEAQFNAPHDPLLPAEAKIPSSYTEALDTVRLAVPVLQNARSLRKPRGFLFPAN